MHRTSFFVWPTTVSMYPGGKQPALRTHTLNTCRLRIENLNFWPFVFHKRGPCRYLIWPFVSAGSGRTIRNSFNVRSSFLLLGFRRGLTFLADNIGPGKPMVIFCCWFFLFAQEVFCIGLLLLTMFFGTAIQRGTWDKRKGAIWTGLVARREVVRPVSGWG